jgi:hypothetical protein
MDEQTLRKIEELHAEAAEYESIIQSMADDLAEKDALIRQLLGELGKSCDEY